MTRSGLETRTSLPATSSIVSSLATVPCCQGNSLGAVDGLTTMTYETEGRVARITLDRPERGNGITLDTAPELTACVERANLDPEVQQYANGAST